MPVRTLGDGGRRGQDASDLSVLLIRQRFRGDCGALWGGEG